MLLSLIVERIPGAEFLKGRLPIALGSTEPRSVPRLLYHSWNPSRLFISKTSQGLVASEHLNDVVA